MKQALGLVEIQGLSTAVVVADTMAKAANIRIVEIENTNGLGYMTIKAAGDVGAVNAAVHAGRQIGIAYQKLVSWKVIPRPSDSVEHTFCNPDPPGTGGDGGGKRREPETEGAGEAEIAKAGPAAAQAEPGTVQAEPEPEADKAGPAAEPGKAGTEGAAEPKTTKHGSAAVSKTVRAEPAAESGPAAFDSAAEPQTHESEGSMTPETAQGPKKRTSSKSGAASKKSAGTKETK